jgi:hypothetical protein
VAGDAAAEEGFGELTSSENKQKGREQSRPFHFILLSSPAKAGDPVNAGLGFSTTIVGVYWIPAFAWMTVGVYFAAASVG